ncbi:MAG: hypothetical protein ACLQVL_26350 [Terriglobia bacterium]
MRIVSIFTLAACLMLGGCLSTVRIKTADSTSIPKGGDVPGIPFYVKTAKCKQETTWIEPVYTLALKKTTTYKFLDEDAAKKAGSKLPPAEVRVATKVLSLSEFQPTNTDLQELLALLAKPNASEADNAPIEHAWDKLSKIPDYLPLNTSEDSLISGGTNVIMISNTASPEAMVDYTRVYYYNAPRPWIGTSQVDAKLAADGTLTEGSAQVQSQTLSTLLTTATSLFSTAFAKVPSFGIVAPTTTTTVQYDLSIQKELYQHSHTRYENFANPCLPASPAVTTGYALTITVPGQPSTPASTAKDDASNVKVTGTVTLPKTPPATPTAPPKN